MGGTSGALSQTYPECVDKVFPKAGTAPQAAMVIEADFVVSEITANSSTYVPVSSPTASGCTAVVDRRRLLRLLPLPGAGGGQRQRQCRPGFG